MADAQGSLAGCPVCGTEKTQPFLANTSLHEILPLRRCDECAFVFARHAADDADRHGPHYQQARDAGQDPLSSVLNAGASLSYWMMRLNLGRQTRILDLGCADGRLVELARAMDLQAEGIDVSRHHEERWRTHHLACRQATIQELGADALGSFDLIFCREVLEHVTEPVEFMRAAARTIRAGGWIVVESGNVHSVQARVMRSRWTYWIPAEGAGAHVSFFSPRSAQVLARRAGLTLAGTTPLMRTRFLRSYAREHRSHELSAGTLAKFAAHALGIGGGHCYLFTKP